MLHLYLAAVSAVVVANVIVVIVLAAIIRRSQGRVWWLWPAPQRSLEGSGARTAKSLTSIAQATARKQREIIDA